MSLPGDDRKNVKRAPTASASSLDAFFRPRSIAVIGASSNPGKIGGLPVAYLKSFGYARRILPVNPNAPVIQDLPAFAKIGDVPGPVDLAIVAVPAPAAEEAMEACAAAGVGGVVMFSAGFAEIGEDGARAQERLRAIANTTGMRLLGPNCLGFANFGDRVFATFSPVFEAGLSAPGRIGLVSQSGSFGAFAYSVARERGLGLSHFIATGNEADLGFAECVEWLADDPATDVIVGYMEGTRDGDGVRRAFARCRAVGKPVVMVKVGRSHAGARAAASHTAALAGDDAVFDGVFRQYGVYRAGSIEECLDIAYAASMAPLPAGRRAGLYTVSGGAGVLMADAAASCGLEVPELSEATKRQVLDIVPFAGVKNPLDITGQVMNATGTFQTTLGFLAEDANCDLIVTFVSASGLSAARGPEVAEAVTAVRATHPGITQFMVTLATPAFRKALEDARVPVFDDPYRAVRAAGALAFFAAANAPTDAPAGPPVRGVSAEGQLTEVEALEQLGQAGLPVTPLRHCRTPEAAGAAVADFDCPVAVKIVSPDLAHKAAVGGVRLNVSGRQAAIEAAQEILGEVAVRAPQARLDGLLVTPMRKGLVECVIGLQRDPAFGPVVMFGLGGVHVEALKDVVFRVAPFDVAEGRRMIGEIRAAGLLMAKTGEDVSADIDALADLLSAVSHVAAASPDLESADMNPVSVGAVGQGCLILDALLIGSEDRHQ